MQKNTEQRKKKKKREKAPPTRPLAQLGRPPAQPTSPTRPLPCSPDRGRNRGRPRRTPSPATGRIRTPDPRLLGPLSHSPPLTSRPLRLSLPPRSAPLLPSPRPTRSPPFSVVHTATVPTSPPHVVSKDRRRPLLRLVQPVGDRSPYNEHTELVFNFGRRRPLSSPAPTCCS